LIDFRWQKVHAGIDLALLLQEEHRHEVCYSNLNFLGSEVLGIASETNSA
jgi:hypothetical protein